MGEPEEDELLPQHEVIEMPEVSSKPEFFSVWSQA